MGIQSEVEQFQGSDSDLFGLLNARTVVLTDHTFYTSRHLVKLLGPDAYRIVSSSLAAAQQADPLIADMFLTLRTTGLNFADPLTQGMIDLIGGREEWPEEVITNLKEIGIKSRSIAELELGRPATQDDIEAARLEIWKKKTIQRVHKAAASFADSVRSASSIWTGQGQKNQLVDSWEQI